VETLPRCDSTAAQPVAGCHAAEFQRLNRCPLWRGLNRWILRRTLLDRPSDGDILGGAGAALAHWFDRDLPWGVDALTGTIRGLARRRPLELEGELGASARLLVPAPTMAGDSFASVSCEFLYFGRADDMPWPVLGAGNRWEPFDCTWALELAGVPS
jgi:hypothetical protein